MPINGVRVLPNMPSNVPHLRTLIREFETTFNDWRSQRGSGSESSTSSGGNFVKKIVQAYEMNMKTSSENIQRERGEERSSLFSNLEIIRNWKNAEKSDSSPTVCEFTDNLSASSNLKMKSTIFSIQSIAETLDDVEDDFVTPNRHCSNSDDETALKKRSKVFSKINMYGPESELPKKKIGQFFCSPLKNEVEDKSKNNKSMTFSSFLEEDEDKDKDPLHNILTNSRNTSGISDNSYRNLQIDLYDFEDDIWDLELSSRSLPSLKSSSESLHDDVLSTSTDSYFQNIITTPSKNVSNGSENFQDAESAVMQSCFKLESPRMIDASLERPTKVDSGVCVTWASAISERLSQKGSLKKILSTINSRLSLTCKKIGKRRRKQRKEQQRIVDSGFAEQFPSPLSCPPQKSWYSDDEKPSTSPTFGTFGHAKTPSECRASSGRTADNPRIVLTEVSHEELANDPEPSDPISWVSIRSTPSSSRKRVDLSPKSASSSRLKASRERPLVPKHPYLSRSRIPKHPFVAQTKMDQIEEKERAQKEEEVRLYTDMELTMRSDEQELRSTDTSSILVPPISALNISYPKTCEWVASSPKSSCNLPSARSCNSIPFDEVALHQESLVYDVPKQMFNLTTDSTSSVHSHERSEPRTSRYATVNSKNLRFSMSREKLRAMERSFDA